LSDHVRSSRLAAKQRLHDALQALVIACVVVTAVSVLIAILLWLFISRRVIAPITRLTDETRQVAGGELTHLVRGNGPTEVVQLGHDVDQMRVRILSELDEAHAARANADRTAESLARSNADLEQFAYVASHDLQEPLRKVANFCQLLERQYAEALDDRARQYIGFAVDGAKRMQVLINDLLDFSRVGRAAAELVAVDTGHAARDAVANLAEVIAEQQATIEIDPDLPTLPAVEALLVTLFQNLIGNGLKYHGDEPPLVRVSAWPESGRWVFAVSDNGIGIDPQYADRIFIIFQRLHLRDRYGGTGIGLALCKRIVEFHGGTIWLDPSQAVGSRFCFTLPEGTAS
jgi:light-regulated signal transduction histidine kinase (bacteriophytochrome)